MARKLAMCSIVAAASLIGAWAWAQAARTSQGWIPSGEAPRPALGHEGGVVSGENVGVRLTGSVDPDGRIQGTLVAKVNGKWVDVVTAPASAGKDVALRERTPWPRCC